MSAKIVLIKGSDAIVRNDEARKAVSAFVGDADRTLMVEELDEEAYRIDDAFEINRLVDAAQTAPFLTDYRVVVGRHLGRFSKKDDVAALVRYLEAPLDTTRLVLVWEQGLAPKQNTTPAPPKSLLEALKAAGATIVDATVPGGQGAGKWLDAHLSASSVSFDAAARRMIAARLGEQRSRVTSLLSTLESVFGPGAGLTAEQIEPYLGERGSVTPWALTDAIDKGDIAQSLDKLSRLHGAGDMHAMQIMFVLHKHYSQILRLDGEHVRDEKAAAKILGIKGFPAKKAMTQARRLGSANTTRAIQLLAKADLDLKGATAMPDNVVLEVMVARLAALSR